MNKIEKRRTRLETALTDLHGAKALIEVEILYEQKNFSDMPTNLQVGEEGGMMQLFIEEMQQTVNSINSCIVTINELIN